MSEEKYKGTSEFRGAEQMSDAEFLIMQEGQLISLMESNAPDGSMISQKFDAVNDLKRKAGKPPYDSLEQFRMLKRSGASRIQ